MQQKDSLAGGCSCHPNNGRPEQPDRGRAGNVEPDLKAVETQKQRQRRQWERKEKAVP